MPKVHRTRENEWPDVGPPLALLTTDDKDMPFFISEMGDGFRFALPLLRISEQCN